jgi:hypothetical protein
MNKVVARFYVSALEKQAGDTAKVTLKPVMSKENARWSQYTPSGEFWMQLTRKASGARDTLEQMVGKECLITLDFDAPPAEQPEYRHQGEPDQLGYVSDEEPATSS